MHLGEAQSAAFQEEMARVFHIVQIVGVVHNAFNIALVVAHLHAGFKDIVHNYIPLLIKPPPPSPKGEEFQLDVHKGRPPSNSPKGERTNWML